MAIAAWKNTFCSMYKVPQSVNIPAIKWLANDIDGDLKYIHAKVTTVKVMTVRTNLVRPCDSSLFKPKNFSIT